jgi:2-phospho-L-lactate guanylyltransferase
MWAVVPLKTAAAAKSRLTPALSAGEREALYFQMAETVIVSLQNTASIGGVLVVTADARVARFARELGTEVLAQQSDVGTSIACEAAMRALRHRGADRALIAAGDLPLACAAAFDELCVSSASSGVHLVPDRRGDGTNVLLCSPGMLPMCFGTGSFAKHCEAAKAAGLAVQILAPPELTLDIDVPEDLEVWARLKADPVALRKHRHVS